jgi:hypothetical protein
VQAQNGGATIGLAETGDSIFFTYGTPIEPSMILKGWDGSPTSVILRIQGHGADDVLTVVDPSTGAALAGLGQVALNGNYANGILLDFTDSQLTISGTTVTVVLGTPTGTAHHHTAPTTMVWTTPGGTATESGAADVEF